MTSRFDKNQDALIESACAYNLADKLNIQDWRDYLAYLESSGANVEAIKKHAIDICYADAIQMNRSLAIDEPEKVKQTQKQVRYRTKLMEKLAGCETLDDYMNLGGVA